MKAEFTVAGKPQGKGRHRSCVRNGRIHTYTPEETGSYQNMARLEYIRQCGVRFPDNAPLKAAVTAYCSVPRSWGRSERKSALDGIIRPVVKPDTDNIAKIIFDALNGTAYRDDAQIVEHTARKFYSDMPRVEVVIEDLEENIC